MTIIYNAAGTIIYVSSENFEFGGCVVCEVPDGYYAESVNPETGVPVLKKIPKTKEQQRLDELEAQVAALTGKEV